MTMLFLVTLAAVLAVLYHLLHEISDPSIEHSSDNHCFRSFNDTVYDFTLESTGLISELLCGQFYGAVNSSTRGTQVNGHMT